MADKLEQSMKKIHIYLANCKESPYSGEELIVSKKRIFALLEELNYAVYDAMEEYEQTVAARDRGLAQVERRAADIKEDARRRSEEIYASSLMYTQKAVSDVKRVTQFMHDKIRMEYETLLADYEDRLDLLEKDSQEIVAQLQSMGDSKIYLRMIEDMKEKSRQMEESALEETVSNSKNVGSVTSAEAYAEPQDEYESKLAASIVVEVHDTPKIPEGFGKGKRKKKGKQAPGGEVSVTSQELDAEYFAFQEEQQQALAEQLSEGEAISDEENPEDAGGMFKEALKLFNFGSKKSK